LITGEGDEGEVVFRMTEEMNNYLRILENIMPRERFIALLQEMLFHEIKEQMYIFNHRGEADVERRAHENSVAIAGPLQRGLIEALDIFDEWTGLDTTTQYTREQLGILQAQIDIVVRFTGASQAEILRNFPNLSRVLIINRVQMEYENRQIVIDIRDRRVDQVLKEIDDLGLGNMLGTTIILSGDLAISELENQESIRTFVNKLATINQGVVTIKWIPGRSTIDLFREKGATDWRVRFEPVLSSGQMQVATVIANGYILTSSGVVTEGVYARLLESAAAPSLSEIGIARLLNNEFYKFNFDEGGILSSFMGGGEPDGRIRQLIMGGNVELSPEILEMIGTVANEVGAEEVNIISTTGEGIVFADRVGRTALAGMKDLLEITPTAKEVLRTKVIAAAIISLEAIDGKKLKAMQRSVALRRVMNYAAVKLGLAKGQERVELDVEKTIKLAASA
jgi:hypothetical protein